MQELKGGVQYRDRRFDGDDAAYAHALATSTTVYVGNLAFNTREEQVYEVRSLACYSTSRRDCSIRAWMLGSCCSNGANEHAKRACRSSAWWGRSKRSSWA